MTTMTTLTTPPVAALLDRMFAEAQADHSSMAVAMPPDELARQIRSKTDYRAFYSRFKDLWLPVSPQAGRLLYMLARHARATNIVEFGTSFGISTMHLAAALRDNGGGRLITTEFEPSKVKRARAHLEQAGLLDLVEFRSGDALQTLRDGLPDSIDLVLLDGAKALYGDVLDLLEPHLRPGALIVADNADHSPDYRERVRAAGGPYLSLPFDADMELSVRVG
ncbi:MAG: O-methyltransferase [Gammaproteobacteria bacterium]